MTKEKHYRRAIEVYAKNNYDVHSPAWAVGFQKLALAAGATCHVKYPDHPTEGYADIWNFIIQQLTAKTPAP